MDVIKIQKMIIDLQFDIRDEDKYLEWINIRLEEILKEAQRNGK